MDSYYSKSASEFTSVKIEHTDSEELYETFYKCSLCGELWNREEARFCLNCGAKFIGISDRIVCEVNFNYGSELEYTSKDILRSVFEKEKENERLRNRCNCRINDNRTVIGTICIDLGNIEIQEPLPPFIIRRPKLRNHKIKHVHKFRT